ncbi:hypothetical protein SASPL_133546 [Salvia splendens]|uniref:Uncharacterized protein n=1 Tax=Salvia splendens TaxID=180675 RepID=A0A8X8X404_SALSN|nr:hypothetical protein SASPL_133546 [Salvia splendens]
MESEGRGYSEFYRNTSEEMFIKTMMESPVGVPMEMLGFKNLTPSFRTDSEELFKSWLTNGEARSYFQNFSTCVWTEKYSSLVLFSIGRTVAAIQLASGIALDRHQEGHFCHTYLSIYIRIRNKYSFNSIMYVDDVSQVIQSRISTELAGLSNQNTRQNNEDTFPQSSYVVAADLESTRSEDFKGVQQASNLFLAKAWFHSSQPMTRSRSSELSYENPTHFNATSFMSPSNSSSSTFHNPQMGYEDKISSVVSMLKGTLERKKVERGAVDATATYYDNNGGQILCDAFENQGTFGDVSVLGDDETRALHTIEESLMEGILGPLNQMSTLSREPSQSESSAAAPMASSGVDIYEDPCISAQAPSVCESSRHQMGRRRSPEDCSRSRDFRERVYDSSREDQKQEGLVRYGSIKSTGSVDRGDPTKKRRVERSRKMAEAKEKSSTPPVPSDMQSILKRCENLEKEVRSLKLNLAFMNRKDSEQTKQIEELQKQNQDLGDEKERLLEEIERIISETANI